MKQLLRALVLFLILSGVSTGFAQQLVTEIIPLGYRNAAELVPILKPLVPPPGTVTGLYTTLVVKATPDTVEAIKQILVDLDRAPRNLMISVRHGISDRLHQSGVEAGVVNDQGNVRILYGNTNQLSTGGGNQANVRIFDTRSTTDAQDVQRVRVLEGREAFIRFGESVPLAQRSVILFGNTVSRTASNTRTLHPVSTCCPGSMGIGCFSTSHRAGPSLAISVAVPSTYNRRPPPSRDASASGLRSAATPTKPPKVNTGR